MKPKHMIASVILIFILLLILPFFFGSTAVDEFLSPDVHLSMHEITNPGDDSLLIGLKANNEKPYSLTPNFDSRIRRYCWTPAHKRDKLTIHPETALNTSILLDGKAVQNTIIIDGSIPNVEHKINLLSTASGQKAEYVILVLPETFPPLRTEITDVDQVDDGFIFSGFFVVQKFKHWPYIMRLAIKEWGMDGFWSAFIKTLYTRFTIPEQANIQTNSTYDSKKAFLPYTFMTDKFGTPLYYKMAGMGFAAFRPYKNGFHYGSVQYYPQYAIGIGRTNLLDKDFQPAGHLSIQREDVKTELHEFRYLDDDRIIQVGAKEHPWEGGDLKTLESAFIQVTHPAGDVLFEWDSFDHVPPEMSAAPKDDWSMKTYDYFHLNCVSPTADGHYIISGRHTQTIMKIDGKSGEILWQMGQGKGNEMNFVNDPKNGFAYQHAPYELDNGHILLFDNGLNHEPPMSRVLEYIVDENSRTAELIFSKEFPDRQAYVAGNAYRTKNGNTITAFGSQGYIEEFDGQGNKVLSIFPGGLVYQAMKSPLPWNDN